MVDKILGFYMLLGLGIFMAVCNQPIAASVFFVGALLFDAIKSIGAHEQ